VSPSLPQATVDLTNNVLTASLPSLDSVTVNLYGATVTSWKTSDSTEQLFLSEKAILDGSKAIRGGIPVVFPVFGPPPKDHATSALPQHGFARSTLWEFLGKNTSESTSTKADDSVKLDFGLSTSMLDEKSRKAWPYEFGLVYSITLGKGTLETGLHVQNKGDESFDFQCLFHTYLRIQDISQTSIRGLKSSPYIDKVLDAKSFTESSDALTLTSETDRVYTPPTESDGSAVPLTITESNTTKFLITRDGLPNVTVWNLWNEKAAGMADFAPKDGWKNMICVEPGCVGSWTKLEAGDAWEGSQIITAGPRL